MHGIGCSLNLNISYYCSSVSWEYRQSLVDYGQAIDPQNLNLPLSGHPLLQKARTFGLGPPPPPLNKYNRFQHTVPSHRKSRTAHWGWERGHLRDVNSWIQLTLYNKSFAPALGGACAMGTNTMALIQTCQIQAIMTVRQRLSFSAQLTNCNLATCWHIELSIRGHLSISIHLSNSFSCSMKFFHLKIALGLALGESWPLLAQPQKNTDVYRRTCINHLRDVNYCIIMGTNTMALIQAIMTVQQRLSFSAQLTNCNVGPWWHIQ